MHLAINSGTDLALFNAWFTYIAEKGWVDRTFIAASSTDFERPSPGTGQPSKRPLGSPA